MDEIIFRQRLFNENAERNAQPAEHLFYLQVVKTFSEKRLSDTACPDIIRCFTAEYLLLSGSKDAESEFILMPGFGLLFPCLF